jgi:GH35 family endo-1,4-beta-xylanase
MQRSRVLKLGLIVLGGLISNVVAELPKAFIDSTNAIIDTLRKRECVLNISNQDLVGGGKEIRVRQLRNHFGFGASIGKKWFTKTDSAKYGDAFRAYFEWATPENEMKWPQNEQSDDYQDFDLADSLISWCRTYDIKVRGHNLFWNERREWMPSWALELSPANFKSAMARRIDGAMTHFKGKVAHWDIINEITPIPLCLIVV